LRIGKVGDLLRVLLLKIGKKVILKLVLVLILLLDNY